MSEPIPTNVGFDDSPSGPPGVALIPGPELERLKRSHAVSGNYAMVSAPGLPPDRAQRLRLQAALGDMAVLNEGDYLSMRAGSALATDNYLLIRRLRPRERLGLVEFWSTTLALLAIAAGGFAVASAFWPVNQSADTARTASDRVADVSSALSTLEQQPGSFTTLAQTATKVQLSLSAPLSLGSTPARVVPRDQHLAEVLEHAVSGSGAARGSGQQAATDVERWQATLQQDSRHPSPFWSSLFDALSKGFAGAAGLLAAVITLRRKPST